MTISNLIGHLAGISDDLKSCNLLSINTSDTGNIILRVDTGNSVTQLVFGDSGYKPTYNTNPYKRGRRVRINNPRSYKRNNQIGIIKHDADITGDYATVQFPDGCSVKFLKSCLILI